MQKRWKVHKIGGAFISNWLNQKIGGATLGFILTKLPKVGGASLLYFEDEAEDTKILIFRFLRFCKILSQYQLPWNTLYFS